MIIKTDFYYSWFDCGCGGDDKTVYIRSFTGITGPTGARGATEHTTNGKTKIGQN